MDVPEDEDNALVDCLGFYSKVETNKKARHKLFEAMRSKELEIAWAL